MGGGGWEYLTNLLLPDSDQCSADKIPCPHVFVKLRSRSRSGEGQVRVRKVKETKDLDLSYTLFLVFTTHPPHKLLYWLLRVLDNSYGPRMGWYDFSMVREG